jgi:hypothetical protein
MWTYCVRWEGVCQLEVKADLLSQAPKCNDEVIYLATLVAATSLITYVSHGEAKSKLWMHPLDAFDSHLAANNCLA